MTDTYELNRDLSEWDSWTQEERDQWNAEWFAKVMRDAHGEGSMRLITSRGVVQLTSAECGQQEGQAHDE